MCPTPNTTWGLQLALCTRGLQTKGNLLTLHPLMELLHKLAAVLFCHTCKLHCFEEVLPRAVVTLSLLPLLQAILNGFLFITRVVLVTEIYPPWGKSKEFQNSFAFPSTLSADVLSEEDSVPLTTCNGDRSWDTSQLMLQLTTPTAAAQVPCNASHEQNTRTHAHSQCTGCDRGFLSLTLASGLRTISISPARTPKTVSGRGLGENTQHLAVLLEGLGMRLVGIMCLLHSTQHAMQDSSLVRIDWMNAPRNSGACIFKYSTTHKADTLTLFLLEDLNRKCQAA